MSPEQRPPNISYLHISRLLVQCVVGKHINLPGHPGTKIIALIRAGRFYRH